MKNRVQLHRIVIAAVAGLAGLTLAAGSASAQYLVGQQGRALDANNRIGGGGFNNPVWQQPSVTYGNLNNNLVTGNITGGKEFKGFIPYSSPDAFRGPTAGSISDQFIRGSSAAPFGGVPQNNAQVVQPFIPISQASPPPPGYVMQGPNGGGYVPAQMRTVAPSDLRLDASMSGSAPTASLPRPGQLLLPGPVDSNTQSNTVITASPLYGWRQWNPNTASDQAFLDNNVNGSRAALNKIDPVTLQRMRNELTQPMPALSDEQQKLNEQKLATKSGMLDTAVPTPFDSPQNQSLSGSSALQSNKPLNSSLISNDTLQTGAGVRVRLMSPQQQSTQYAELQKRLQQNRTAQAMSNADAQNEASKQLRDQQAKANTAQTTPGGARGATAAGAMPPGPAGVGVNPAQPPVPPPYMPPAPAPGATPEMKAVAPTTPLPAPSNLPPASPDTVRPAPLQIHTLAEGVQAKGLADLLKEAEAQMKAGKFNSALEEYDLAEQLAPNNPLILLGRANAELGQSYYGRAELHLRQAFMQDQALLMGQFDLGAWLGNDRLTLLVQDLRAIADREQKEARPVFLLAYIYYSTGDQRMAAAYLDLAEKRSGGKEELYPLIRKHWQLPQQTPAEQGK